MDTPLAISMGEPAGVGPDIALQLYARRNELNLPPFCLFGHPEFLQARAARLGLDISLAPVGADGAMDVFANALPVAPIEGIVPDQPGHTTPLSGKAVIAAIEAAVAATLGGACRGLITAPIHKAALYQAGFQHPGHTEFLAALCQRGGETPLPVMMLAHGGLRAVPVTIHVPIRDVPDLLHKELIVDTVRVVAHDLRQRFGIAAPQIAVAGLNPHAGEGGTMGRQEADRMRPLLDRLRAQGLDITGPLPADTMFHAPARAGWDAAVCAYHDQALIPIKTLDFAGGVNVTLGLPFVRTSPDHGTALDIAGQGRADPESTIAALRMAHDMAALRA